MIKIMIVGGGFSNKGAQSMLLITVDELRKKFGECDIYFANEKPYAANKFRMKSLYYSKASKLFALYGLKAWKSIFVESVCDMVRFLLHRQQCPFKFVQLRQLLPHIDIILDISGFALSSKWNRDVNEGYIDNIRIAKKYDIQMILMPQSFGPFEYLPKDEFIIDDIKNYMRYPKIVFARERSGYALLSGKFGLSNIVLSTDIVLQNSNIEYKNIFKYEPRIDIPELGTDANIGIIPNVHCLNACGEKKFFDIYFKIISELIKSERYVFIMYFSNDDLSLCRKIKAMFIDERNVVLLERQFSCVEFSKLIQKFDVLVSSRYHSIVHAYRKGIPCVSIGWADKYNELAENLGHEKYVFDISSDEFSADMVINAISDLEDNLSNIKKEILNRVSTIQNSNCFEYLLKQEGEWKERSHY